MRIKKIAPTILTLALLMLAGCTSKEEMLQQRVQSMAASAELGTVEYTVKKIVKCNDKQTFSIGDRKILFQSTAYLKAGVDLAGFTADDIKPRVVGLQGAGDEVDWLFQ